MSKFNIGDKVVSKRYTYLGEELGVIVGIDTRENAFGKYLVKFDSLEMSEGLSYRDFVDNIINNTYCIAEPYEGYAIWLEEEDLTKVKDKSEEEVMSKLNIGDKVISNDSRYLSEEVGTIVGIDTRVNTSNKYLVKFDSLDISEGWIYGCFCDISLLIIEPYEGYAIWLDDIVKVEDQCEEECEEDIRTKFESVRKQKEEIVKEKSKKVLELTLEIKEIEHEIEKIKKEWRLD